VFQGLVICQPSFSFFFFFSSITKSNNKVDLLDSQGLCVTDVGQVGDELEAIHNLAAGRAPALDAEAEDAAKAPLQQALGRLMVRVALEAWVRDPGDVGAGLEVARQGEGVLGVALGAQAERLDAEQQLLGGERVERGAQVAQDLDAGADDEGDGAERVPELEPVVALGRLDKLREPGAVLAPIELARVDEDAADGGAVATDPLGRRVDDNVGAMVDGTDEVATSPERVVNLPPGVLVSPSHVFHIQHTFRAEGKMERTTRGTPFSWATLAMASISGTL
jgi:hypothetical protein